MKKNISLLLILLLVLSMLGGAATAQSTDAAADTVIYGNFYTMEESSPWAQAVAISDGKYVYVGDADGAQAYIGDDTVCMTYDSGVILPGLADSHSHGHAGGATAMFEVEMYEGETAEEYQDMLREFVNANPDLELIRGAGWINSAFDEKGPTRQVLDEVCPDKPVAIMSEDGHSYWINTKMIELCGMDENTPDIEGGVIPREENGYPAGTLRENALNYLYDALPAYTVEEYKEAILCYQEMVAEFGETLYFDPMVNLDYTDNAFWAYEEMDRAGELLMPVYAGYQVECTEDALENVAHAAELMKEAKGGIFEMNDVKIILDGVVEAMTAYVKEPYMNADGYCGEVMWDFDTLVAVISEANCLGMRAHIHAIGDAAVTMAVDALEASQSETGISDIRNALTHVQLVDPADFARIAKLNVVVAANPYWFYKEPGYFHELEVPFLGSERAEGEYPMKAFFDEGIVVTNASDYPVTVPPVPLDSVQYAVIRMISGMPETLLGADQCITLDQALMTVTQNAAFQMGCEDVRGSIALGKEADLVVLGSNIITGATDEIAEAEILATFACGKMIFGN